MGGFLVCLLLLLSYWGYQHGQAIPGAHAIGHGTRGVPITQRVRTWRYAGVLVPTVVAHRVAMHMGAARVGPVMLLHKHA